MLAAPAVAAASSPAAQRPAHCKNDGHKYIFGQSATTQGKNVAFVGKFERFHPCGEDDGHFTEGKTITLTLTPKTTIKVFTSLSNEHFKTVTAAQFVHRFNKSQDEPHYQWSGPHSGVKKMKEHFVS